MFEPFVQGYANTFLKYVYIFPIRFRIPKVSYGTTDPVGVRLQLELVFLTYTYYVTTVLWHDIMYVRKKGMKLST